MTENEAKLIIKDLTELNARMDRIDRRLDDFIKAASEIQVLEGQITAMQGELARNRESIGRAFTEIERINKSTVEKEKIEAAIKKINDLELQPMKKDAEIVKTVRTSVVAGICSVISAGAAAFIMWLIQFFKK
jgi:predicted  nucleic acid-binding Zn-ribbon protein